jgi:hypothetical protein
MALSLGFSSKSGKSTTNTDTKSQSAGENDPWDYSIPYLQDYLREVGSVGGTGITPDQKYAYEYLKGNAFQGNPWDEDIAALASDQFDAADRSGQVGEYYGALEGRLSGIADGDYTDVMNNPELRAMLDMVGNEASSRVNQQFAAAGRDLSGLNQRRVAQGVTEAQLPVIMDQYNRERQRQMDAATALYGAGSQTAGQQSSLDAARNALRSQGIDTAQAALDARNQGANQILELDQQIKMLPYEDLGMLGSLLLPVAGAGGQQTGNTASQGTSKTKSKSSGFSIGI